MTESNCPFCMNPIHPNALVCGSCQAQKGYWQKENGDIYDKADYRKMGVGLPIAIAVIPTALILLLGLDPNFHASAWVYLGLLWWVCFWLAGAVYGHRRLQRPPSWYRRRHNN